jgi:hypothetical protein
MRPGRVRIPAAPLQAGVPLPPVCIPHGRPAVATRPASFEPKPKITLFLLFGVLDAAVAGKVHARALPVCDRCLETQRARRRLIPIPVIVGLAVVLACLLGSSDNAITLFIAILAIPVGAVFSLQLSKWARWNTIMNGEASRDRAFVDFEQVSPSFQRRFAELSTQTTRT